MNFQLDERIDELEAYRGKWVNCVVTKRGIFNGIVLYDSQKEAMETAAIKASNMHKRCNNNADFWIMRGDKFLFPWVEFICHIQIPSGEPCNG